MELRKIARVIGVELRTIQYHLLKKIKEYKELYNQFIELLKKSKLVFFIFVYLYSFIKKKK